MNLKLWNELAPQLQIIIIFVTILKYLYDIEYFSQIIYIKIIIYIHSVHILSVVLQLLHSATKRCRIFQWYSNGKTFSLLDLF